MFPAVVFVAAASVLLGLHPVDGTDNWSPVCPRKCVCQVRPVQVALLKQPATFRTVDCSGLNLQRIPSDLPAEAEALLLPNNSIRMHVGINLMPQLRLLDLAHNRIQGFFGRLQLPQLEHLDLSYNAIPRVSSSDNDFFAPLRNLQTLNLRGNTIQTVQAETLELPRLTSLDLSGNHLSHIDEHALISLHMLRNVDLSNNDLAAEDIGDVFEGLQLSMVNLSDNRLVQFLTRDFVTEELDLSRNWFATLSRFTFDGIRAQHLQLGGMPTLWLVSSSAFDKMKTLNSLDLSRNGNLTYIEPGSLSGLYNLTSIDLDYSGLLKLPADMEPRPGLAVSLRDVPLSCYLNSEFLQSPQGKQFSCRWRNDTLNSTQLIALKSSADWRNALPVILPVFPFYMEADVGTVLELQCLTFGNVSGLIWYRIDEKRNREYSLPSSSGVLRLGPLYRVDSGRYMCRVYNEFGSVNRSVNVNVTYAPVVIIPLTVTQQYVTFAWNNSDPSIASQFRVTYYEFGGVNFSHVRTIYMGHLVRTYTISNLKSGTLYKLCLLLNKSGIVEELDCKNITTQDPEVSSRSFQSAQELVVAIACISGLLFMIFMSTCVYRFYQEKQQDSMAENLSRILLSDSSCTASEAATPTTYFNPGIDPLTPTTDLDVRAAFLPEHHPYRNIPFGCRARQGEPQMQSTQF
ncbi:hypothetical protein BV898_07264 [Hypsibius exemplaris]|uniref:Ig-like domain-containing protein n=1 Tax=Hypsibius exemplaris TaxID=2072580 RepID=A0A1W0WTW4_HYPEX|nr:hypothetical protein BV898_07264 [Hypsibius exemplaris]